MPGDRVLATTGSQPERPGQLTIRRGDTEFNVTLTARLACDYTVQLEPDTELGDYGYFSGIHVTYGQVRGFPDGAMLAFVVGHEVGHFVSGHPYIRVGVLGGTVAIDVAVTKGLLTAASQLALRSTWRREEFEADRIGLLLARQAGYDPDRILEAWPTYAAAASERVKRAGLPIIPEWPKATPPFRPPWRPRPNKRGKLTSDVPTMSLGFL
jgi:Zn-dependent protease with chaperone function